MLLYSNLASLHFSNKYWITLNFAEIHIFRIYRPHTLLICIWVPWDISDFTLNRVKRRSGQLSETIPGSDARARVAVVHSRREPLFDVGALDGVDGVARALAAVLDDGAAAAGRAHQARRPHEERLDGAVEPRLAPVALLHHAHRPLRLPVEHQRILWSG